jgi:hypothetical protein
MLQWIINSSALVLGSEIDSQESEYAMAKSLRKITYGGISRALSVHNTSPQCCGSVTFWYGLGSADPCLILLDPDPVPDPAIFVTDLQDANKNFFPLSFPTYYFLKVHLHHFSKIKSHKIVGIRVFLLFLLDNRRTRIRTCDKRILIQEAQLHTDPADPDAQHCFILSRCLDES